MPRPPVVLIADRSRLASNLYRLLLAPMGLNLLIRQRAGEALIEIRRKARVDLIMFSSNSLGPDPERLVQDLVSRPELRRIRKILIAGESKRDRGLAAALSGAAGFKVIDRPFYPDDLAKEVEQGLRKVRG